MDNRVYRRSACVTRGPAYLGRIAGPCGVFYAFRDLYVQPDPRCCVLRNCCPRTQNARTERNTEADTDKTTENENKIASERPRPTCIRRATTPQLRSIRFDWTRLCVHPSQGPPGLSLPLIIAIIAKFQRSHRQLTPAAAFDSGRDFFRSFIVLSPCHSSSTSARRRCNGFSHPLPFCQSNSKVVPGFQFV